MAVVFKTKSAIVHEKIKNDIISGKIKPGEKVGISKLSKKIGMSEIPIREALKGLESEGYITFTPHLGACVTKFMANEVIEVFLIRIELEALATKLATPHMVDADFDYLDKKMKKMEQAVEKNNFEKVGKLNRDFHLKIYKTAPYPILYKLITDLMAKYQRIQSIFVLSNERAVASMEEHKNIVGAIKKRNSTLAANLMREQKIQAFEALKKYFTENGKI
jgi:DNA-binding GntR family transcriptional regulator